MEINEEIKKRTRKLKKTNLGASRLAQESKMNLSSNERAHAARLSAGRDTPFPAQLIYTMIKLISVNDEYKYGKSARTSRPLPSPVFICVKRVKMMRRGLACAGMCW